VRCVRADLLEWEPDRRYDLWHDRAVFHFLVEERGRDRYIATLNDALAPGGHVIVATFADDGPEMCSGLPVRRYAADDLGAALGEGFELVETRREVHVTPRGKRQPFTWVAARLG
jgi:trans-aconitate methyltransferase